MYNSSRRSVRRALFQNTNKLSIPDHINLCWAWEQVTPDGTWCDRDNYQTWVDMAKIFNTTPKSNGCTYVDTMTPEELKPLWMTVEKEVNKYHCFYAERKVATGRMEDYHTLVIILN